MCEKTVQRNVYEQRKISRCRQLSKSTEYYTYIIAVIVILKWVIHRMSRKLVAYFSATGTTAKVAERLAESIGADIFEIQPKKPYTQADLDWRNKTSRSSIEMHDLSFRPETSERRDNIDEYETIFVGFPIWWYIAPTIINTFLESYDLRGKTIVPFATSGGSGMGNTNESLRRSSPGAKLLHGRVFSADADMHDFETWIKELNL